MDNFAFCSPAFLLLVRIQIYKRAIMLLNSAVEKSLFIMVKEVL